MNHEHERQLRAYDEAWPPGNVDGILSFFADDAVFEDLALESRTP